MKPVDWSEWGDPLNPDDADARIKHASYCARHKLTLSWDEYKAATSKKPRGFWGPPGGGSRNESKCHYKYCKRHKIQLDWDEFCSRTGRISQKDKIERILRKAME